ncbi:MAG: hypothetical protein RLZZ436_582 [Planctomycetota bacterium]
MWNECPTSCVGSDPSLSRDPPFVNGDATVTGRPACDRVRYAVDVNRSVTSVAQTQLRYRPLSQATVNKRTGGSPRLRFRTLVRARARGVSSALPGHFTRGLPPCGSYVFGIAFAEMMSGRAEAPGCDSHPGAHPCPRRQQHVARALYPQASARRLMRVWHRVCRDDERTGGSPRLRFRTLVRTPARGVSRTLPGLFTRRLPPGGSVRSHFSLLTSHFSLLTSHFSLLTLSTLASALYPRAAALRLRCGGSPRL